MREFIDILSEASNNVDMLIGTKIVDEAGNPLMVFHGTAEDFKQYRLGGDFRHGHGKQMPAIYFTPLRSTAAAYARTAVNAKNAEADGQGIIKAAYLSIKNPKIFSEVDEFANADRDDLISSGFDGAVRVNQLGSIVEIAALDPSQVIDAE